MRSITKTGLAVIALAVLALGWPACKGSTGPTPTMGTIQIASTPTGAEVFLDGADRGMMTNCSVTNVSAGNHTIKLIKDGYADYQGTAMVTAGKTVAFNATLTATTPAALEVTPATGLTSSGSVGGPFTPASQDFTLKNTGGSSLSWTAAAGQTWVTVAPASGMLAAGASATVTASINTGANALAAGTHNADVTFTNATNGNGNTTRSVGLTVSTPQPAALSVTPSTGLASTGNVGGPFTPSSQDYTLQNTGGASLNWTAAATQAWTTVSPASGTLAAGATATVTVTIGAGANALAAGAYSDTVTFTNATNGNGNTTRAVGLNVLGTSQIVFVTVNYTQVTPLANPNGNNNMFLNWTYTGYVGNQGLANVSGFDFTSPQVRLATETVITMWVVDDKEFNGTTSTVCAILKINGQLVDVGATVYGQATFIIGNNGVIRKAI
ncbi:MAG TPA: PEGA domain-containing protein [Candidatus Bathyarchaeia archaeon]|nr:PEGA domain-containing protein [Candidatus Bathyarchaeia archaeon]